MTAPELVAPDRLERLARDALVTRQATRLRTLLDTVAGANPFYTQKLDHACIRPRDLRLPDDLGRIPFTTKLELVADQEQHPPWGTARTEALVHYTRYNQTSSTTGRPLRWLDTNASWQWALDCWKAVYRAARVIAGDRIFFPFSFGPFLGFWTAFEAGVQIGAQCVPAGGLDSHGRLALMDVVQPTVVCCTPTYALRLAEISREARPSRTTGPSPGTVRVLIVAGEPGGSIPATRQRIEDAWGARVIDHHGLTEVGPLSFTCWENPGDLHLNECEFLCEVIDPATGQPAPDGTRGELVVTTLGRHASPVIRYRTGDLVVRDTTPCRCGRTLARLRGGILARADDMICVRGVNVYPSAVEGVIRTIDEVVEYRATVRTTEALTRLVLEVEVEPTVPPDAADRVAALTARKLRDALGLNVPVTRVGRGVLPRFDMKAKRFSRESEPR